MAEQINIQVVYALPEKQELLSLAMPAGTNVSGLESDGAGLFYAGGGPSGKVRAVRRPPRPKRTTP